MTMCNCQGPGLESMSTEDLVALRNVMEKAILDSEQAKATLFGIRYELRKRGSAAVQAITADPRRQPI